MPQMKKVVVAMGNRLIYSDTYEQAIAELAGLTQGAAPAPATGKGAEAAAPPPRLAGDAEPDAAGDWDAAQAVS